MGDIKRRPDSQSVHHVHTHNCPNCKRDYSCNCAVQSEKTELVCRDCESGTYDPVIHGGQGEKRQA